MVLVYIYFMCLVLQNNFKHSYMWFKTHWNYFLWFETNNVVSTYSCFSLQMWSCCLFFCFVFCYVQVMLVSFCCFPFCLNKCCNIIHIPLFHFGHFLVIWHLNVATLICLYVHCFEWHLTCEASLILHVNKQYLVIWHSCNFTIPGNMI